MLALIVAMARNRAIGLNNRMPWHLPADFAYFKQTTMGHPIIMGRKTFESIGRPLPGRRNIVVTRNRDFSATGIDVAHSLDEALALLDVEDAFIIGGATLYRESLARATRLYVTEVDATPAADTYFPEWNPAEWREVSRTPHLADDKNALSMSFVVLDRV
jgi:dihydrofolate reductase